MDLSQKEILGSKIIQLLENEKDNNRNKVIVHSYIMRQLGINENDCLNILDFLVAQNKIIKEQYYGDDYKIKLNPMYQVDNYLEDRLDFSKFEPKSQPKPTPKSHKPIRYIAALFNIIFKHPLWSAIIAGLIVLVISHLVFGTP